VLVAHGYTDLVTPYFASELILRQLDLGDPPRVRAETYRGGHMFYIRDDSRHRLREDARRLYEGRTG
jgi:carboxypeptidase C (cathepsin A)